MTDHDIRPAIGQGVLHLFFKAGPQVDAAAAVAAVKAARAREDQVVSVAMLGHKADIAVMGIGLNLWSLRELQTDLVASGLELVDSYVSLTELSEYAKGIPEEMQNMRLYPELPPEGKNAWPPRRPPPPVARLRAPAPPAGRFPGRSRCLQ